MYEYLLFFLPTCFSVGKDWTGDTSTCIKVHIRIVVGRIKGFTLRMKKVRKVKKKKEKEFKTKVREWEPKVRHR